MSLIKSLNSPPLVAMAGAGIAIGLPVLEAALSSSASLTLLKSLNVAAFAANVIAVSIPGRLDGQQDQQMREGDVNPDKPNNPNANSPLADGNHEAKGKGMTSLTRMQSSLVNPSGWAFAIWGPIYIGETIFVAAQLFASDAAVATLLPAITAPFVAANLLQTLWCASFRPSYGGGYKKYISAAMLAGTGCSLSLVHSAGSAAMAAAGASSTLSPYLLVPLTMHFGWVTAATLVNLNGALASEESASPGSLIALGNSSAVAAAALGVGLTVSQSAPAYGLTLAWALAACADGMARRVPLRSATEEEILAKGAGVQRYLCWAGSFACAVAAACAGFA